MVEFDVRETEDGGIEVSVEKDITFDDSKKPICFGRIEKHSPDRCPFCRWGEECYRTDLS